MGYWPLVAVSPGMEGGSDDVEGDSSTDAVVRLLGDDVGYLFGCSPGAALYLRPKAFDLFTQRQNDS
jgi:hypothetical protein